MGVFPGSVDGDGLEPVVPSSREHAQGPALGFERLFPTEGTREKADSRAGAGREKNPGAWDIFLCQKVTLRARRGQAKRTQEPKQKGPRCPGLGKFERQINGTIES